MNERIDPLKAVLYELLANGVSASMIEEAVIRASRNAGNEVRWPSMAIAAAADSWAKTVREACRSAEVIT